MRPWRRHLSYAEMVGLEQSSCSGGNIKKTWSHHESLDRRGVIPGVRAALLDVCLHLVYLVPVLALLFAISPHDVSSCGFWPGVDDVHVLVVAPPSRDDGVAHGVVAG